MSLYGELKRRNVIRVAAAYVVGGWLLSELASMVFPYFGIPDWNVRFILIALALGFLPALVVAWCFVITSEGVIRDAPISRSSARRLDVFTVALITATLSLFVAGKLWFGIGPAEPQTVQVESEGDTDQVRAQYPDNSIAVLPFVNMSDDASNEYFSDGVSEELLNLLAKVRELRVTSRSSAFSFKGKAIDVTAVANKLNVAHVLEGSVRKADNRVRITVQLIAARSDTHLWSDTYDRELDDIFAIQDDIAGKVVEKLKVTLLGASPTSEQINSESYTLYLQARYLGRQGSAESLEKSNVLYLKALDIHPQNASAWSGLATNYTNQAINGLSPFEEYFDKARAAAESALSIDPGYAPAHANLGWISLAYDNDVAQAARHYARALQLGPGNTYIIRSAAVLMRSLGRLDDAILLGELVTERDPLVASGHHNLGIAYFRAGRWDEAIASQQTSLRLSPHFLGAHYRVGMALLFKNEAAAALEAVSLEKDDEYRVKGMSMALYALGRQQESQARLAELQEKWGNEWPTEVSHVYAYMGEVDAAFHWLDKAFEIDEEGLSEQFLQPFYQSLHADPRWPKFLEQVGSLPRQLNAIEFRVTLPD